MRKRRKSIAHWLFLIVGIVLLVGSAITVLPILASYGWLSPEWAGWTKDFLAQAAQQLLPSDEQLKFLALLAGIAGTVIGAALTLLASWHFAEMNLARRIEDLKNSNTREHLSLQPRYLALARRGLGSVPADIETSRLTLMRSWLSGWSQKEQARVLAASSNHLAREAAALSAAVRVAQHRQITAHLIRGYQHAAEGDDERAFDEFEAATRVMANDVLSRDITAGWARKTKKLKREVELLMDLQGAAGSMGLHIDQARALRREAELLEKRKQDPDWVRARNRLKEAQKILDPLIGQEQARLELGRVLTLLCEVQCSRTVVEMLAGPNGPLTRTLGFMTGVAMHRRPEEPDGEEYGEKRVLAVGQRVAELRGDVGVVGDDGDNQ